MDNTKPNYDLNPKTERNIPAVALAFAVNNLGGIYQGYKAGVARDENARLCKDILYINTPTGQLSYHFHPDDAYMLDGLPQYDGDWDGTFNGHHPEFVKTCVNW